MAKHSNTGKYKERLTPLNDKDHFLVTNSDTLNTEHVKLESMRDYVGGIVTDPDPDEIPVGNVIINGSIFWVENLQFQSTPINYFLNGEEYTSLPTTLFLIPSDETLNRIDVFVVNDNGEVVVKTGTPSANPQEPTIEFASELRVTSVLITAGATSPSGFEIEQVYNENTEEPNEWNNSLIYFGSGNAPVSPPVNFASTTYPNLGTFAIEGTELDNDNIISFDNDQEINLSDISSLAFDFLSKENLRYAVTIRVFNGNVEVKNITIRNNQFGLSGNQGTTYGAVNIPLNSFLSTNSISPPTAFDKITFIFNIENPSISSQDQPLANFYLDNIRLISGLETPSPTGTFLALNDVLESSYSGKGGYIAKVNPEGTGMILEEESASSSDGEEGEVAVYDSDGNLVGYSTLQYDGNNLVLTNIASNTRSNLSHDELKFIRLGREFSIVGGSIVLDQNVFLQPPNTAGSTKASPFTIATEEHVANAILASSNLHDIQVHGNVTGALNIDFLLYGSHTMTLTGDTTQTFTNVPDSGKGKTITQYVTGDFNLTLDANVVLDPDSDTYDGTTTNRIVSEFVTSTLIYTSIKNI